VLRDKLEASLQKLAPQVKIFGFEAPRVHNTSMFALEGVSSETQLIALDLAGIQASNGSACSSGTVKPSAVLKAMGVPQPLADGALRVSLGWNSTAADIDRFIEVWTGLYNRVAPRLAAS
jgi:cysteine desulfurase